MKRDMLDAADQLRNQLGLCYWTLQHDGDVTIAVQQLQTAVRRTEQETAPWSLDVPQTLFARWSQLQLTTLLREARQVLHRMTGALSAHDPSRPVHAGTESGHEESKVTFL